MDDHHEKFVAQLLRSRKAEALGWLRGGSTESFRNLGEMDTTEESIQYVERLYKAGAVQVIAVEIYEDESVQNTGHLLVQLPADAAKRRENETGQVRLLCRSCGLDACLAKAGVSEAGARDLWVLRRVGAKKADGALARRQSRLGARFLFFTAWALAWRIDFCGASG